MNEPANQNTQYRALGLSALGVVLAAIGGLLAYSGYIAHSNQAASAPAAYRYTVQQSAAANVAYFDSSFYSNGKPSLENNAYIAELTDAIQAKFNYSFSANQSTLLTTTYNITATVQSNYALKGDTENSSNVWQKQYRLVAPTTSSVNSSNVALNPSTTIPYAEYKQVATDFRSTLTLPTTSQVVVTLNIQTSGTVDNTPFNDTRVSSITIPLEEQIYQPAIAFDKSDTKEVVPPAALANTDRIAKIQLIGGGVLTLGGLALAIYGLRKRIFKSPYQRELDKIYRYHDGIIVRTNRPVDLTDHQVVPMRSFDDMLNLEEELKTPIIADEISSTLTHFLIAHHNVTYLFKLGDSNDRTNQTIAARTTNQALAAAEHPRVAREVLAPAKINQSTAKQSNDDWGDIINELEKPVAKKPLGHHPKRKIQ